MIQANEMAEGGHQWRITWHLFISLDSRCEEAGITITGVIPNRLLARP